MAEGLEGSEKPHAAGCCAGTALLSVRHKVNSPSEKAAPRGQDAWHVDTWHVRQPRGARSLPHPLCDFRHGLGFMRIQNLAS